MFDIKLIRENPQLVRDGLKKKNVVIALEEILENDKKRKELLLKVEELRAKQNAANDEIAQLIRDKKDAREKIASMKIIASQINEIDPQVKELDEKNNKLLLYVPNLPHSSVPVGSPECNRIERVWGSPKKFLRQKTMWKLLKVWTLLILKEPQNSQDRILFYLRKKGLF